MTAELEQPIRGMIPPLVTPLTESRDVDQAGLERLIEHQLAGGIHGLFMLGTTGEGPSLSCEMRREVIQRTSEQVDGRALLLVGITDSSLRESIALARTAADAQFDAAVAAPPFYYPISQEELLAYYRRLLDQAPLPVMLYNMPEVAGVVIEPETIEQLLDHPRLAGLKDSSGDLAYFERLLQVTAARPDFPVTVGSEQILIRGLQLGAAGGVPGGGNINPGLFVELYNAVLAGDDAAVAANAKQLERLLEIYIAQPLSIPTIIARIKSALASLEICQAHGALPILPVDEAERQRIAGLVAQMELATTGADDAGSSRAGA